MVAKVEETFCYGNTPRDGAEGTGAPDGRRCWKKMRPTNRGEPRGRKKQREIRRCHMLTEFPTGQI